MHKIGTLNNVEDVAVKSVGYGVQQASAEALAEFKREHEAFCASPGDLPPYFIVMELMHESLDKWIHDATRDTTAKITDFGSARMKQFLVMCC
jgi:hypothetical protein